MHKTHELRLARRMARLGTETAFEVLVKARALEAKGHLRKLPGKARGLVPSNWAGMLRAEFPPMPILGRVPAGGPLLAEENLEGTVDLSEGFAGQKVFAPRQWFRDGPDTRDLIPARWERL